MISYNEIRKGNLSIDGMPFIKLSASSLIKINTLQYTLNGQPWWGVSGGQTTTITIVGNVKRILKVDWPYVKKVINVEG